MEAFYSGWFGSLVLTGYLGYLKEKAVAGFKEYIFMH